MVRFLLLLALLLLGSAAHGELQVQVEPRNDAARNNIEAFIGPVTAPSREAMWRLARSSREQAISALQALGYYHPQVRPRVIGDDTDPVLLQIPIGSEQDFIGVVDVVKMRALTWRGETTIGEDYDIEEIPDSLKELAEQRHQELLERCADVDDTVMEKFLEGEQPTVEEIQIAIRNGVINNVFTAVVCGTSFKNKGVQPLLDAVTAYLPSPMDVPAIDGFKPGNEDTELKRRPSDDEPLSVLTFKIAADPHLGRLTFCRIYSGVLKSGENVLNSVTGKRERIGKIYQMHANKREEIPEIGAGMICAVMGLKNTTTGDTLCDQANPIVLESMTFPAPVIEQAIEPKTKSDQEKLGMAIQRLAEEDPTFRVHTDDETGQTIIAGMGELHLDVLIDRMKREFKVEANIGKPQVAYRETLRRAVQKVEYTHKKQTGGSGQFGRVIIDLEPQEAGAGYEFVNGVTGGRIPREYIPAVDQGIREAMQFGVLAGYPVEDIKVTLTDGAYHDVDSSEMAFKLAGSMAFKEAARRADPAILEPMMAVEVTTPEDYLGTVIGDLNSRRGQVQSMDELHGNRLVRALVPLSEMFGYVGDLRSKTSGQATYSMEFDSYAETPRSIAEEIVAKARGTVTE